MTFSGQNPDMLGLLHYQNHFHTAQLSYTHEALGKLYKKLWRLERRLTECKEKSLTRKEKKQIKWTAVTTRATIRNLEAQQKHLHEYLRQYASLIASYDPFYIVPPTPWSAATPTSTYPWTPYSSIPSTPWTAVPLAVTPSPAADGTPQYWDLSMLPNDRNRETSPSAADSGFHEPSLYAQPSDFGEVNNPDHVWAHEVSVGSRSKKSSLSSEGDDVPELASPGVGVGADASPRSPRRRRYSENAIQLTENRFAVKRTVSEGPKDRSRGEGSEEAESQ